MKDTLSTLDLNERPGQRIRWFRHFRHFQRDAYLRLATGEISIFSSGPHHAAYSYTIESENNPNELPRLPPSF